MKTRCALLAALGLGLGLTLALLWAMGGGPPVVQAQSGTGFIRVATTGSDVPGCGSVISPCQTVQYAVDEAADGDDILIASGVYTGVQARAGVTQVVIITKTLALSGGYTTTNWTTSDPVANPTTLAAERQGRVIYITDDATPTIEGLIITGGDGSTGGDGNGGGIAIQEATAIIRYNVISDNVGGRLLDVGGDGGGIYVITSTSPVLIYNNTIQANVGYSGVLTSSIVAGGGLGGGIAIGSAASAIITSNQILSNTAAQTDIPSSEARGYGGGIGSVLADALTIEDNTIQGNLGVASGLRGFGGGIMSYGTSVLDIADNTVIENTAIISGADAAGGAMWLSEATTMTLTGNWVLTNTAGVTLTANPSLYPDPWAGGGGVRIHGGSTDNDILTMQDNHLIGNVTARTMTTSGTSQGHAEGGGLIATGITTTLIISNEVRGNIAVENLSLSGSGGNGGRPSGGGMHLSENDTVTLSGNEIRDNVTAKQQVVNGVSSNSEGGGVAFINVLSVTLSNNTVSGNSAVVTGSITITDTVYDAYGGGIMVGCWDRPSCNLSLAGNNVSNNTTAYTITVGGTNAGGRASGGGLSISEVANASFNGDTVSGNRALVFGSADGNWVDAQGGGLNFNNVDLATVGGSGCAIEDNVAAGTAQEGQGGGIRSWNSMLTLSGCTVKDNWALVSGGERGEGGGLSVDNNTEISDPTVTLTGNWIEGNVAFGSGNSEGNGGGVRISGVVTATLTGNTIISNVAAVSITVSGGGNWGGGTGGGVDIGSNDSYTPTVVGSDNVIAYNTAAMTITVSSGGDGWARGGGVRLDRVTAATVISNQVRSNVGLQSGTATDSGSQLFADGGGLNLNEVPTATLQLNRVEDNAGAGSITLSGGATNGGAGGGGIDLSQTTALLQSNVISGNTSNLNGDGWGGGVNANQSTVTMEANTILGNRMNPAYSGGNGGVWVWQSTLTSVNDVFARNYDGIGGGDGGGNVSTLILINDTLYDNYNTGVSVNDSSTVYVTNTIVYGHDQGLSLNDPASTLIGNYNLLSNTVNYAGGVTPGANDITDTNPIFLDAPNDDFHIASNSPAVDAGTSVGAPSVDFDDEPRPQGSGVDIGADEAAGQDIYLPIIMKNY
jgi:hypothetical protein